MGQYKFMLESSVFCLHCRRVLFARELQREFEYFRQKLTFQHLEAAVNSFLLEMLPLQTDALLKIEMLKERMLVERVLHRRRG